MCSCANVPTEDNKNEKSFNFFFRFFLHRLFFRYPPEWLPSACVVSHKFDYGSAKTKIKCGTHTYSQTCQTYTFALYTLWNHWFYVMGKKAEENRKFIFTFDNTSFAGPFLISMENCILVRTANGKAKKPTDNGWFIIIKNILWHDTSATIEWKLSVLYTRRQQPNDGTETRGYWGLAAKASATHLFLFLFSSHKWRLAVWWCMVDKQEIDV